MNNKTIPTLKVTLIAILLLMPSWAMCAEDNREYVLVISSTSSHRFDSEETRRYIQNVAVTEHTDVDVLVTQINEIHINDMSKLDSVRTEIVNSTGGRRPKMIMLIGFYSYILCDDFNNKWPDVPMLLTGERDFTGPAEIVVSHEPITSDRHLPLYELRKYLNLTFLQANSYPKQTIQLMRHIMPKMDTLVFICDDCYSCLQNDYDLRSIVREDCPGMAYYRIASDSVSTDELLITLGKANGNTTGAIYSSWRKWGSEQDDDIMSDNFYRTVCSLGVPVFSLRNFGTVNWKGCVGGCFFDEPAYEKKLSENIRAILNGTAPRDIPFYYQKQGTPTLNYNALTYFDLLPENCPEGSVIYNMPPDLKNGLLQWIRGNMALCISLFCAVVISFLWLRIRSLNHIRKMQDEEKRMKKRIHEIINTMPLLYMYEEMIFDENGAIIDTIYRDVNKAFNDRIMERADCIGRRGSELFPESMPSFLQASNIAKRTGKSINFQYYHLGQKAFYDIMVRPSEKGRFMEFFCMDCTGLHKAQEALRNLNKKMKIALETAHVSPWCWELDNHTIFCEKIISNSDGETFLRNVAVTENKVLSLIHSDDRNRIRHAVDDLIAGRKKSIKEEYRTTHIVDGKRHKEWVEVRASVEKRDDSGHPLTLVGSRQVITHRKEMEEELVIAKKNAEESNKLKSSFLANMSHEIRTPLNAIVGFSELLVNTENDEERGEYVHIIESNSDMLLQLVGDILDLSKIEAGTIEFTYSDFDLNKLMTDMANVLQMRMSADKQVTLSYTLGMERCVINSERNRLMQLVTNLVINAIKFTDEGSICFGYERQGDVLHFYVKDTGCGIAEDKQKDIFERFVKLNTFKQGTGLGLSICKSIVETLGGEIGVVSRLGEGSTFNFTIPYQPVKEPVKQETVPQRTVLSASQKVNILVAEDNESNYKLIKAILSKEYNLFHAWNGREAVEMFNECKPQLILMDINMPEMDGYEATREIRKLSADVPILALTAYAYASDEERILKSGMNSYMSKPVNTRQLQSCVDSLIRRAFVFL